MTQPTDSELLRDVAADRSESAFAQLVRRHVDLVYASALRQAWDPATADDVTQAAFLLLWRKAARLRDGRVLCAWLLTVVRLAARDANRRRRTRQLHEQQAAQMKPDPSTPDWDRLRAVLDAGLADLSRADRTAIALRYLPDKSSTESAAESGVSEAAAKKRAQRAVGRLRQALARRGFSTRADVLEAGLGAVAVAAPPRVAEAIAAAIARPAAASAVVAGLARGAWRSLLLAQARTVSLAAGVVLAVVMATVGLYFATAPVAPTAAAARRVSRPTSVPSVTPPEDRERELDRLEAGLAAQEQRLSNLRVEATVDWERWDPATAAWKFDGQTACTGYYDGKPIGKARIDYHKEVRPWIGGAGPFSWGVSEQAFDGQADRLLTIEVGTPDHHARILQRVELRHHRSVTYDGMDAGWSISTFGGGYPGGLLPVVRELRLASAKSAVKLGVTRSNFAGAECLVLTAADRAGQATRYYFTPALGYAFRGTETDGRFQRRLAVEELVEVAPGVYYPERATGDSNSPGDGQVRWRYEATSAVADAALDPSVFRLSPPGVPVYDVDAPGRPRRIAN